MLLTLNQGAVPSGGANSSGAAAFLAFDFFGLPMAVFRDKFNPKRH